MAKKQKSKNDKSPKPLPRAELDVLACLWQTGSATARDMREMMLKYRPMAHGSVVTLLTRLEHKNLVSKEKGPVGKAFVYKPTRKPESMYRSIVKETLARVFSGNMVLFVETLLEAQTPTVEELDGIRKAVTRVKPVRRKAR